MRATYQTWQKQVGETNKCVKAYLRGEATDDLLMRFFDHESEIFQAWGGPDPEKDWSEDSNR